MAYTRREVTDGKTVMNKDLYDNLQDGVDECKEDLGGCQLSINDEGCLVIKYNDGK